MSEFDAYSGNESDLIGLASGDSRAHIAGRYCRTLGRFIYRGWRPGNVDDQIELAEAVELVAHEAQHLMNTAADESETECHAVQSVRRLARLLGAAQPLADRLQRLYWTALYPDQDEEYVSAKCRNDGVFDQRPETDVFP